jgi:hypothetical protein
MNEQLQAVLSNHAIELMLGFFTALVLGFLVDRVLRNINKEFDTMSELYGVDTNSKWGAIYWIPSAKGSADLGEAERALFFLSWFILPEIVVGWFLFKVASKWELWNNIYQFPSSFEKEDPRKSLAARIWLGARTYQRFLLGAILNILVSLAGYSVYLVSSMISLGVWEVALAGTVFLLYLVLKIRKMRKPSVLSPYAAARAPVPE